MTARPLLLLALVLVGGALAACGGDDAGPAAEPVAASGAPDAQTITVLGTPGLDYEPAVIAARPGTLTLTLRTESGPPHDLRFDDASLPAIPSVGEGEELSETYDLPAAGTFDFVCTFHPGMEGSVVVS